MIMYHDVTCPHKRSPVLLHTFLKYVYACGFRTQEGCILFFLSMFDICFRILIYDILLKHQFHLGQI